MGHASNAQRPPAPHPARHELPRQSTVRVLLLRVCYRDALIGDTVLIPNRFENKMTSSVPPSLLHLQPPPSPTSLPAACAALMRGTAAYSWHSQRWPITLNMDCEPSASARTTSRAGPSSRFMRTKHAARTRHHLPAIACIRSETYAAHPPSATGPKARAQRRLGVSSVVPRHQGS